MRSSGKSILVLCGSTKSAQALSRQADSLRSFFKADHISFCYKVSACKARLEKYCELLVISSDVGMEDRGDILNFCHKVNRKAFVIPTFYEVFCAASSFGHIGEMPVLQISRLRPSLLYRGSKRLFDFICALTGLLALWPLFAIIAVAIKLDSSGSVFYTQHRVGRNQKPFQILKFRTMVNDAEKYTGPVFAARNDPRVTRVGRVLRAVRLDELPQLINVLTGEMSIVGPRPERPYFVNQYSKMIPQYEYRFFVRPGITGLAQVYGGYDTAAADKLVYDLFYISKAGLLADIAIILKTFRVLLQRKSCTEAEAQTVPAESVS